MIVFVDDWGKVLTTLTRQYDVIHPISYDVISRYEVGSVMLYTTGICVLLTLFLGMLIFLCNILFQNRSVGIFITVAFVLLDWFVYIIGNNKLLWISPISWIQIENMAYARELGIPSVTFAVLCLVISNIVLMLVSYIVSKRKDVVNV